MTFALNSLAVRHRTAGADLHNPVSPSCHIDTPLDGGNIAKLAENLTQEDSNSLQNV